MEEVLYDDKLAGEITRERYETKKAGIKEQLESLKDELSVADSTVTQKHSEAIDLIKLTQHAKEHYHDHDQDLSNEQKRTILTKLFDSVVYKDNSVSIKYSFLARSIVKRSAKTCKIMKEEIMLNQTIKNDTINRSQNTNETQFELLFLVWQGIADAFQTAAIDASDDHRLKHLVKTFQLSGDLLTG
jgi:hypothetical protein